MKQWQCKLEDIRRRSNRWQLEGTISDSQTKMPFTLSVRLGWVTWEAVQGAIFEQVLRHFKEVLGEPQEPPTCSGSSECQDDAVHMTTSWQLGNQQEQVQPLLERLLRIPIP